MCSRPSETRSRPRFLAATLATLPSMSLFPKAPFELSVCPWSLALPRACASYLAALPSTRAIPDRDVFCLANPVGSAADFEQILTTENQPSPNGYGLAGTKNTEAPDRHGSLTSLRPL